MLLLLLLLLIQVNSRLIEWIENVGQKWELKLGPTNSPLKMVNSPLLPNARHILSLSLLLSLNFDWATVFMMRSWEDVLTVVWKSKWKERERAREEEEKSIQSEENRVLSSVCESECVCVVKWKGERKRERGWRNNNRRNRNSRRNSICTAAAAAAAAVLDRSRLYYSCTTAAAAVQQRRATATAEATLAAAAAAAAASVDDRSFLILLTDRQTKRHKQARRLTS